jgi:thioredoxin:protein disulfide reductase
MRFVSCAISCAVLSWLACLHAQAPAPASSFADTPHLTLATSVARGPSNAKLVLVVEVSPKAKMHVYAPGEKDGIPVTLTIDPQPSFKVSSTVFPAPEKYYFEPLKLTQLVFSKPFKITVPISGSGSSASSAASAPATVQGSFRYQACDDRVCYVPKTVRLSWTIHP